MTRHGTLAYYLAAWVIGCFVAALVFWLVLSVYERSARSSVLLEFYFFALMMGAVDSLWLAFLLRRSMHWFSVRNVAVWSLAGAALLFVTAILCHLVIGKLAGHLQERLVSFLRDWVLSGPELIGWWQAPIDGAATAAVLCLIDRAFNRTDFAETRASADKREAAHAGKSPA